MCESNAYLKDKSGSESLLMKDVAKMEPLADGKWKLETIMGDEVVVEGRIVVVDFEEHRVILEKK